MKIIAEKMGLSAEEIALRKEFLELREDDVVLLKDVNERMTGTHIDEFFSELFYKHLRMFHELHTFVPDDATVSRLKGVQAQYFKRLIAGVYDEKYVLDRLKVGYAHQRIGLEPKWYTGAYRKYLSFLLSNLHQMMGSDSAKFLASYDALLKVVFFDMELALDTYFHSDRQELFRMANHDALTGLPNRYLLSDRITQAIHRAHRESHGVAILFVDIDRFKTINDSLGHEVGDDVICEVSARFSGSLREGDTLARLGGDEFAIVLPGVVHEEQVAKVAQKMLHSIERPVTTSGAELFAAASIGIAIYPRDGTDEIVLLKNADAAMYLAKQDGGNTVRFYREEMNSLSLTRLSLESRLRHAFDSREFFLHYQPQIDLATGRIVCVEALLRWQPNGVMVSPADLVSIMEETGLIIPVGEWILRTACSQVAQWNSASAQPIRVAVNLSARQFVGQDLVETISRTLAECDCEPSWLELEITESAMMQKPEAASSALNTLVSRGVRVSMDDFGTGYSSLSHLKQFPVDVIKIDRSFVRHIGSDQDDGAIICGIIALARSLRLHVVAEGVEDEHQHAFLVAQGCDAAQGYLYSRPISSDGIEELLLKSPSLPADHGWRERQAGDGGAPIKKILDIGHCRVRKLDAQHAACVAHDGGCGYMLPYGGLCGHPLVDVIADLPPARSLESQNQ